jgi:hypothetical protein
VHTVDAQGRHVIAATHTDPTLSLAKLAQVRALGRIRLDTSDLPRRGATATWPSRPSSWTPGGSRCTATSA